jgi:PAS domain S-box-containing protein
MTVSELVQMLSTAWDVGIVVTDADLDNGPHIVAANAAFCRLTGFALEDMIGKTPRLLQGDKTSRLALNSLSRKLRAGERHLFEVMNYRKSGEAYMCQLDIRPIRDASGRVQNFIAFEREVRRQRGRPVVGESRFRPIEDRIPETSLGAFLPPFST